MDDDSRFRCCCLCLRCCLCLVLRNNFATTPGVDFSKRVPTRVDVWYDANLISIVVVLLLEHAVVSFHDVHCLLIPQQHSTRLVTMEQTGTWEWKWWTLQLVVPSCSCCRRRHGLAPSWYCCHFLNGDAAVAVAAAASPTTRKPSCRFCRLPQEWVSLTLLFLLALVVQLGIVMDVITDYSKNAPKSLLWEEAAASSKIGWNGCGLVEYTAAYCTTTTTTQIRTIYLPFCGN